MDSAAESREERRHTPPEIHTPLDGDRLYMATERNVKAKCPFGGCGIHFYPGPVRVWRRDRRMVLN